MLCERQQRKKVQTEIVERGNQPGIKNLLQLLEDAAVETKEGASCLDDLLLSRATTPRLFSAGPCKNVRNGAIRTV